MECGAKKVEPTKNRGGEWVTFGDEQYRVPALGFGALRELQENIKKLAIVPGGAPSMEQMDIVVGIVHSALRRNYPDMARGDVEDMLDIENYQRVLEAVLKMSLTRKEKPEGEAQTASE
jgi:hypothetical protein